MRVLVSGDRNWADGSYIEGVMRSLPLDSVIIEGEARGADTLAREAAHRIGLAVLSFPAQWGRFGRGAGPIRNRQMLVEGKPDVVWAFHDDFANSKGTRNMVHQARKAGIPVKLFSHKGPSEDVAPAGQAQVTGTRPDSGPAHQIGLEGG